MRGKKNPTIRYICPACLMVYFVTPDEVNQSQPRCLKCDSPLIKSRWGGVEICRDE
jgi:transcription initiation factor IIE alpha subunit